MPATSCASTSRRQAAWWIGSRASGCPGLARSRQWCVALCHSAARRCDGMRSSIRRSGDAASRQMTFLYKADPQRGAEWARLFAVKAPELPFRLWPDVGDPADVRYLAAWEPPDALAETFPNLEVLLPVDAGVDQFDFPT